MADPDVVPALVALGFSLDESRAYATLTTQRAGRDIGGVMAKMLRPRIGRLDTLLSIKDGGRGSMPGPERGDRRPWAKASP